MPQQNLVDAAYALMGLIRANITSIKNAPNDPPESTNQFPFAAAWPGRGRMVAETQGDCKHIATLILEIHVARKNLPVAMSAVYPFVDDVKRVLFDPVNNGLPDSAAADTIETLLLDTASGGVTWIFSELEWNGTPTIGWRFEIQLKQVEVIA